MCALTLGAQQIGLRTVAIDAGHGGTDPGAISRDNKTFEKNLTIDIVKRLAKDIEETCPDVKVILTRGSDYFVSLNDRAVIANKAEADLFMSIHINAAVSSSPNGYSVHILGQSSQKNRDLFAYNMDVCKRENSVILLESDYTTKYQGFDPNDPESFIFMQLMQNTNLEQSMAFAQCVSDNLKGGPIQTGRGIWQDPFYVLWKTAMPAVLVELGFISNAGDLSALRSADNRQKIADALLRAFQQYKKVYDDSMNYTPEKPMIPLVRKEEEPADTTASAPEEAKAVGTPAVEPSAEPERYGVQIFSGSVKLDKKDRQFMGYEPLIVPVGKVYRYVIGVSSSMEESTAMLKEIRKRYPDAFLVKIVGGKVIPAR